MPCLLEEMREYHTSVKSAGFFEDISIQMEHAFSSYLPKLRNEVTLSIHDHQFLYCNLGQERDCVDSSYNNKNEFCINNDLFNLDDIVFLNYENTIYIHDVVTYFCGGNSLIRDIRGIEAAIARPQCGYYDSVYQLVASYLESFLINHPFVDGNKRTSFCCADIFLRMNGYRFIVGGEQCDNYLHKFIIDWVTIPFEKRFDKIVNDLKNLIEEVDPNQQK